ncbi:2-dehydro-3-deoxygalactonokinase [Vallitalea sediminicola]
MNKYIITIDTGTTNTRIILWRKDRELVDSIKISVGVRNTAIDGNNSELKKAIKQGLEQILNINKLGYDNISKIMAGGMITSNVGLIEIPHLTVPVSITELKKGVRDVLIEEICPIPISFIPGVKNKVDCIELSTFEQMDIMRGEEIEAMALIKSIDSDCGYVIVLPGSHTKFIKVDASKKIVACLTTLTGEILSAITNNTIIADAVGKKFVSKEEYDRDMLLLGYNTTVKAGLSRAVFSARIINQFCENNKSKIANFILGAVLENDIEAVKNSVALSINGSEHMIVSGKSPFRQAIADIFKYEATFSNVTEIIPKDSEPLSGIGALLLCD